MGHELACPGRSRFNACSDTYKDMLLNEIGKLKKLIQNEAEHIRQFPFAFIFCVSICGVGIFCGTLRVTGNFYKAKWEANDLVIKSKNDTIENWEKMEDAITKELESARKDNESLRGVIASYQDQIRTNQLH